jgi:cbb3-type cytochrome oxidase subunit 1
MKFIVTILLCAFLGYVAPLFLPWWGFVFTSFVVALLIPQKPWKAFLSGFLALFLFWGIDAFFIDLSNQHLLATKIARLLPLNGSYLLLILLTAITGGLVSGLASLTGSLAAKRSTDHF